MGKNASGEIDTRHLPALNLTLVPTEEIQKVTNMITQKTLDNNSHSTDTSQDNTPSWGWQPVDACTYASTPLPDQLWCIDGLVRLHSVTVWHGLPGSLKTQLLLDAAGCIAAGAEWLPTLPNKDDGDTFSMNQAKVLWLNFDMANEDIHERVAAIKRTHDLQPGQFEVVSQPPEDWLDLSKTHMVKSMASWVKSQGYGLVVIDNLSATKGKSQLIDESMTDVFANVRHLSVIGQCNVWLIHHETKANDGKTAAQRMHGSVFIAAGIDAAFSITRTGDYVTIEASKQRNHMVVTEFCAYHTWAHNERDELDSFRFFAVEKNDITEAKQATKAPLQHDILRHMNGAPATWKTATEVAQALDSSPKSVTKVLARMAEKGLLETKTVRDGKVSKSNPCLYCVAAGQRVLS